MTLSQQFLLVSILPVSFLILIVYLWRSDARRHPIFARWVITLFIAAVWSSSVIRFFGDTLFSNTLVFNWGIVGSYAFSGTAILVMLTTFTHLSIPWGQRQVGGIVSLLLLGTAVFLDPLIFQLSLPAVTLTNQSIQQFDLWAAVWIASWLVPVLAAWLLTQQANNALPNSLFRNQVSYWLTMLTLFLIGGGFSSILQRNSSTWQQIGALIIIVAAMIGTASISRHQLPDLQLGLRQVLSRISGGLIIFGLTLLALSFLVEILTNLETAATAEAYPTLVLILAAALFAGFFTLIFRLVNRLTERIFLPTRARRKIDVANYANAIGNLPEPAQLAQLFLRVVQSSLLTDDAWFFTVEDGPAARLLLRPLATLTNSNLEAVDFANDSPFATHMREQKRALAQQDIDSLTSFATMSQSEKDLLTSWKRALYMPLHAGDSLVGVLALAPKYSGEPYDRADFSLLTSLSEQISPLLAQALNIASLRQINDYVFQQNQTLAREKHHLEELSKLFAQFINLISPELRRPFSAINKQVQKVQTTLAEHNQQQLTEALSQEIAGLQKSIDNLIALSGRIQVRSDFNFGTVQIEQVVESAINNLRVMADARRVEVNFEQAATMPRIHGDAEQLVDAVQALLHNAIKFNKIGGQVSLQCGITGKNLCLEVKDTGVGIPQERLQNIWGSFAHLQGNGHANGRGSGLGLALANFIVAAHGGHVDAQSVYGAGSTFSIYLPLQFQE